MKYFFNLKNMRNMRNMKNNNYFYFVLPTALYGVSITCYSFYHKIFNSKKIEEDIIDRYKLYRDITD